MSIIYDALQKTQTHRSGKPTTKIRKYFRNTQWFDTAMFTTIFVLFIAVVIAYYPHIIKLLHNRESVSAKPNTALNKPLNPAPIKINKPTKPLTVPTIFATGSSGKITLNGVFLSGEDKFAMINNQTFRIGDIVEGMTIVKIEFDKVQLRDAKSNLIIRATA